MYYDTYSKKVIKKTIKNQFKSDSNLFLNEIVIDSIESV